MSTLNVSCLVDASVLNERAWLSTPSLSLTLLIAVQNSRRQLAFSFSAWCAPPRQCKLGKVHSHWRSLHPSHVPRASAVAALFQVVFINWSTARNARWLGNFWETRALTRRPTMPIDVLNAPACMHALTWTLQLERSIQRVYTFLFSFPDEHI